MMKTIIVDAKMLLVVLPWCMCCSGQVVLARLIV